MDTVVTFRNEALLGTDLVTDVSRLLVDAGSSINDVRELVIADAGIEDVDLLLGQLEPGTDLWRVDSQADMASMFSAALSGAYTRLHVLGHGQPGSVTLGGRALQVEDFTALSRGNVVVQSMHFWSCMTGAGIKGRAFVDGIAKALGVVVTAFSALVGAERNGGGWSPDILSRYGEITSVPFINATAYPHTLPSSALQVKSVVTSTGVDVQVWLTAGTSINNATLSLNYDPAKVNPVLVSNQVAYTSGVAGWSWLSSQTSPTCLEIGSYGSVNAISSSSDILLNSVSFTLVQGSSGFSISLAGSYLEDADGTIALGTLPSLTYIALAAPVWDAFTPPENLSYIAGATASLDFAVKATDANGDTITYKAVVGQMSNVATFEPTAVLAEISLTASNGHLTGSAVFLQTTTAGNYVLRLYADDNTADAISGTPLDVPFVLSAPLDTLVPTVAITSSASALKAGETAKITFTFSEDPGESFDAGDITTTGGTLGTLSGTGLVRTATFTPTASLNSGNASITVGAGSYTDTAGNPGIAGKIAAAITVDTTTPSSQTYGITAHTKYWNSETLIKGVELEKGVQTGETGSVTLSGHAAGLTTLTPSLISDTAANGAVDLLDAIDILKSIVGLNTLNGYQQIAADFDRANGVDLNDAIGILKHVVGLTAPTPEWAFVSKTDLSPNPSHAISVDLIADTTVDLVGILRGDVDGSWSTALQV